MTETTPTTTTTADLRPGDRVLLYGGRVVRTVDRVVPNGATNSKGAPLFDVLYVEGGTPEWSGGNSSNAEGIWQVAGN